MPFQISLSKTKVNSFYKDFKNLTGLDPNLNNFKNLPLNSISKLSLDQFLILNILSRPLVGDEPKNMIDNDENRIRKVRADIQFDRKAKKIDVAKILSHYESLKDKNKYTHAYIRFGDKTEFDSTKKHKEEFEIFFGGVNADSQGNFYKKNGGDFVDINGKPVNQASIDSSYTNFKNKNSYLRTTEGVPEFDECNSIGGVIHKIDILIATLPKTSHAIPAYEIDSQRVIPNDGNPYALGCNCPDSFGKTTVILTNKQNLRPSLINFIINIFQQTNDYSFDLGQGCCS